MKIIESGLSIGIIVIGAFVVSMYGGFSLSQELEWYIDQGFNVANQDYSVLSESLSSYTIEEHRIDKMGLREQALYVHNIYGKLVIFYDTNNNLLYLVAHKVESTKTVMVFVWKASVS